jgi:hypothetical protein
MYVALFFWCNSKNTFFCTTQILVKQLQFGDACDQWLGIVQYEKFEANCLQPVSKNFNRCRKFQPVSKNFNRCRKFQPVSKNFNRCRKFQPVSKISTELQKHNFPVSIESKVAENPFWCFSSWLSEKIIKDRANKEPIPRSRQRSGNLQHSK